MQKLIVGTTPAFKFIFKTVDPGDIRTAILTIKDKKGSTMFSKELPEAVVGSNYISWTLSQNETLLLGDSTYTVMCNWVTRLGIRGASVEEQVRGVPNHIEEVI